MKYLFSLNINPKTFSIAKYNPTCKAIIKSMYLMKKKDKIESATGDEILEYAVKNNIWSTRQDRSRYHTTWSFYWNEVFKHESTIVQVGTSKNELKEEFLEVEEETEEEEVDTREDQDQA